MRHVNTVLGSIAADDLGRTYIHEHLYVKPSELPKHYPYTLDNVDKSIEEASLFREAGGCSIVDLSPLNFGRNAEVLADIAEVLQSMFYVLLVFINKNIFLRGFTSLVTTSFTMC